MSNFYVEISENNHVTRSDPYASYDDAYDAYSAEIQKRLLADKTGTGHAAIRI